MSVAHILDAWAALLGDRRIEKAEHGNAWMVYTDDGRSFVLKQQARLSFADPRRRVVEEHRVLTYLAERGLPVAIPLLADDARMHAEDDADIYVLSPMLPSSPAPLDGDAHREIGATVAELHLALADYPFEITSWTIELAEYTFGTIWEGLRSLLAEEDFATVAQRVTSRRDDMVASFHDLPMQRIHGDCHGANILTSDGKVSGLIDLDHLPIGPRVYDLAYCISLGLNWMIRKPDPEPDPLAALTPAGRHMLAGYHAVSPLSEHEIAAVVPIMLAVQLILMIWVPEDDQKWLQSTLWVADHYDVLKHQLGPAALGVAPETT